MNKVTTVQEAAKLVKTGMTVMVGGFGGIGTPNHLIEEICNSDTDQLEIIADDFSPNHLGPYTMGLARFLKTGTANRGKMTFLGTNSDALRMLQTGELTIEYIPQGTFIERIHAGGTGLGGFYTPTGVGTEVAEGKETRVINGREYLFEEPLTADVALLKVWRADTMGNCQMLYTAKTFNLEMAMASETVIVEAEEIVEPGELDPSFIHIPGVFVDYIVDGKEVIL